MLSALSCSPLRLSRSPTTIARGVFEHQASCDHFAICLAKSREFTGRTSHDAFRCRQGEVFFLDLMQSVDLSPEQCTETLVCKENIAKTHPEILILWIPRARMLKSLNDESAPHGLALTGNSAPARLIGAILGALALKARATGDEEFDALAEGVIELTASISSFAACWAQPVG